MNKQQHVSTLNTCSYIQPLQYDDVIWDEHKWHDVHVHDYHHISPFKSVQVCLVGWWQFLSASEWQCVLVQSWCSHWLIQGWGVVSSLYFHEQHSTGFYSFIFHPKVSLRYTTLGFRQVWSCDHRSVPYQSWLPLQIHRVSLIVPELGVTDQSLSSGAAWILH